MIPPSKHFSTDSLVAAEELADLMAVGNWISPH
jgi:hypothetical protein